MDYHTFKDLQEEAERLEKGRDLIDCGNEALECSVEAIRAFTYKALEKLPAETKQEIRDEIKEYGLNAKYASEFLDFYLKDEFKGLVLDLGCGDYILYNDVIYSDEIYNDILEGVYKGALTYAKKHNLVKGDSNV